MTAHQHIPESARETRENSILSRSRLGLIGYPIGHSLSPTLFRKYFASRPDILEQWEYDLIERSTFDEARAAFLQDYTAVNVTAPFKENAFRTADSHDYSALRCQASNLLVKTPSEGVKAYNTDFEAVLDILRQEHTAFQTGATGKTAKDHEMRKMKVLVIGAGGAGKAAAAAAVEAGMQTSIWNRTSSRAIEFADHLRQYDPHGMGSVTRIIGTSSVPFENSCPATNPATDLTADPAANPATDPATDPTADPAADPATDPGTNQATDPATNQATDPAADPATDPATNPATDLATDLATVSAPEHRNPDKAHASIPQDIQTDTINFTQTELLAAIRQSDIIIYTIPGPSTSDNTPHRAIQTDTPFSPPQAEGSPQTLSSSEDISHAQPADTISQPAPTAKTDIIPGTKAECSFLTLLDTEPDILSDKTVIEANYKDPVLAAIPCRRYISGLTWLRLQAIATYRIVLGPSLL